MRIAVVQCNPVFDDAVEASDVIAQLKAADAASIDLVLFPEAFLLGHSYDRATIAARARAASPAALDTLTERVCASRNTLAVGLFELEDTRVRNSAGVIERGQSSAVMRRPIRTSQA